MKSVVKCELRDIGRSRGIYKMLMVTNDVEPGAAASGGKSKNRGGRQVVGRIIRRESAFAPRRKPVRRDLDCSRIKSADLQPALVTTLKRRHRFELRRPKQ